MDEAVVEHLLRTYGARWPDVVGHRQDIPGWSDRVVAEAPVIRAQLVHACWPSRRVRWTPSCCAERSLALGDW